MFYVSTSAITLKLNGENTCLHIFQVKNTDISSFFFINFIVQPENICDIHATKKK